MADLNNPNFVILYLQLPFVHSTVESSLSCRKAFGIMSIFAIQL